MKSSIFGKLLTLMLLITVIPLAILGYLAVNDAKSVGMQAAVEAQRMGHASLEDSTTALNTLGEDIIRQKAIDVAKQIEIFLRNNPEMTVEDLQNDPYFSSIAVQPVGKTGYTAITDVETLFCRFHSNPKVANTDLHNLAEKLPGFWSVMFKSQGGIPVEGYYDWAEPDGSIKQKYMYIAIVDATTSDDVRFSVAATTYIDEFSMPAQQIGEKINSAVANTVVNIKESTESLGTSNTILTLTIATIIIVALISFLFARSISEPIRKLKEAADRITSGEFDAELPAVKGRDEITELTASMEMLIMALKTARKKKK